MPVDEVKVDKTISAEIKPINKIITYVKNNILKGRGVSKKK